MSLHPLLAPALAKLESKIARPQLDEPWDKFGTRKVEKYTEKQGKQRVKSLLNQ